MAVEPTNVDEVVQQILSAPNISKEIFKISRQEGTRGLHELWLKLTGKITDIRWELAESYGSRLKWSLCGYHGLSEEEHTELNQRVSSRTIIEQKALEAIRYILFPHESSPQKYYTSP